MIERPLKRIMERGDVGQHAGRGLVARGAWRLRITASDLGAVFTAMHWASFNRRACMTADD